MRRIRFRSLHSLHLCRMRWWKMGFPHRKFNKNQLKKAFQYSNWFNEQKRNQLICCVIKFALWIFHWKLFRAFPIKAVELRPNQLNSNFIISSISRAEKHTFYWAEFLGRSERKKKFVAKWIHCLNIAHDFRFEMWMTWSHALLYITEILVRQMRRTNEKKSPLWSMHYAANTREKNGTKNKGHAPYSWQWNKSFSIRWILKQSAANQIAIHFIRKSVWRNKRFGKRIRCFHITQGFWYKSLNVCHMENIFLPAHSFRLNKIIHRSFPSDFRRFFSLSHSFL